MDSETNYISANPGQTVNLLVKPSQKFADGYIPVLQNIFDQNMAPLPGFPVSMSPLASTGAYFYPFTVPAGNAGLGSYTADVLLESALSLQNNDLNYFNTVSVSSSSFSSSPNIVISFQPSNMIFICTSGNICFSFDGETTAGIMSQFSPLNTLYFGQNSQQNIWLSGTGTFLIYAYQNTNNILAMFNKNGSSDLNYFKQTNVSAISFNINADIVIPFNTSNLIFVCTAGNVNFSFDGYTLNGIMSSLAPLNTLYFGGKTQSSIWLSGSGTFLMYAYAPAPGATLTANEFFVINSTKPYGISVIMGA